MNERAFLDGFIKAANAVQLPAIGASNTPPNQPNPGQPGMPMQPQAQKPLFYQLLAQFKKQNPMPQPPSPA